MFWKCLLCPLPVSPLDAIFIVFSCAVHFLLYVYMYKCICACRFPDPPLRTLVATNDGSACCAPTKVSWKCCFTSFTLLYCLTSPNEPTRDCYRCIQLCGPIHFHGLLRILQQASYTHSPCLYSLHLLRCNFLPSFCV